MKKNFTILDKNITIYKKDNVTDKVPLVIFNSFDDDGDTIWNLSKDICPAFVFAVISQINWDDEMSPWYCNPISQNDTPCTGGADKYLDKLINDIIPSIKEESGEVTDVILTGYSLSGLFAFYSCFKTDIFDKVVTCSGSFWYPKFIDYVKEHHFVRQPKSIYFSLGDKESLSKNKIDAVVGDNTKWLESYCHSLGIKTIYEENTGGHFKQPNERMVKGIKWILDN